MTKQYGIEISLIDDFTKEMKAIKDSISQTNKMVNEMNSEIKSMVPTSDALGNSQDKGRKKTKSWLREVLSFNRLLRQTTALVGVGFGINQIAGFTSEVIKTEQAVSSAFGVTGAELQSLTSDIQNVSTVFGADLNETIQSAAGISREFGLDTKSSIDLIQTALSKGLSPEFVNGINDFAPAFSAAGIKADEMLSILAQAERLGIKENVADAIKEANDSLSNLSGNKEAVQALSSLGFDPNKIAQELKSGEMNVQQVLGQIQQQMQKVGMDSEKSGKALNAIFGKNAEAIKGNLDLLTQTPTALSDIENRTTRASAAQQTLLGAWAGFKDFLAQTVIPIFADVIEWVKANQESILFWGQTIGTVGAAVLVVWAAYKAGAAISGMISALTTAWNFLKNATNAAKIAQIAFNVAASLNPIGLVVAGIAAIGAAVYALISYWDTVVGWLSWAADLLWKMNPLSWMINFIEYIFPGFKSVMASVFNLITAPFKAAWSFINNNFIAPIRNGIGNLLEWLGVAKKKADDTVDSVNNSSREIIGGSVKGFMDEVKKISFGENEKPAAKDTKETDLLGSPTGKFAGQNLGVSSGLSEVKGDARQMKNINITIEKLSGVETLVSNSIQESASRINELITKAVMAALNDANNIG